ncbi:tudor domain-containing protein 7 isoform X2 [Sceloporus undulatus]|nr:tudor domain-containing protein 7 isoform X2 [Sceloporus undulatus]XP_042307897.1 tudor domain-containing protein 7 isoform X2 [Sceloporus undulatus]XP_042307898.1 tudor domain-containing protein 7 isoform X2 [Sceloporus undulatus]XP_042307899.1 tudor domain-containing protein 7 isoform X2 [Sceloporus undulatus]
MQEADRVAKILRSILQSHKNGVPFYRLQGEYKSFTGDVIPFKQLGHSSLEEYLKSIPGFVRFEAGKSGEVICCAVVCEETAGIAQLVACQRTSKRKSSREVNCRMRLKQTAPLASVGKPKGTLRQPGFVNVAEEGRRPLLPMLRNKGSYVGVRPGMSTAPYPLSPEYVMAAPKEFVIQGHMTVNRPERRLVLPPRFHKELQDHLSRNLPLDLNENVKKTRPLMQPIPPPPPNIDINDIQKRIKEIINRFSNGILLSKIPHLYKEMYDEDLNAALLPQLECWPHICVAEKVSSGGCSDVILYPAGKASHSGRDVTSQEGRPQLPLLRQTTETKATVLDGDLKQQVASILLKYPNGLWASALPKTYENMYKTTLPQDLLSNLDLLSDICTIDYTSGNPNKAILYAKSKQEVDENLNVTGKIPEDLQRPAEQQSTDVLQESQEECSENITVPPLIIPEESSPSVLVVELNSTNEVVVRYVGKGYSAAQELMEDEMKSWYSQNSSTSQIQSPEVGQVVAVPAEEDAWLRAQIVSIEGSRIKVCYVDYGFNEIIENTRVYKLAKHFCSLPFQASKCRLAGLEAFCDDVVLVKMVESQTCGKIFAVEILEKSDIPLVILYDTSGEDDININAVCLKALCDKSLELQLQVAALYTNVRVTNVCSDGTLYCQVPSKGLTKLSEVMQKLENYFNHKNAADYSVSLPYCGMICLLNCKGKWARVQITSVHSTRALDVQFMDTGTVASVKVVELREIPSAFLREIIATPPQAIKCCLADLPLNISMWTPDAVLWLRDTVLNCPDCSIKVVKLDDRIAHIYLFTPMSFPDPDRSINRQITNADLWKHQKDVFLSVKPSSISGKGDADLTELASMGVKSGFTNSVPRPPETSSIGTALNMPPPLPLAQPQEHMDVFVSLACHPGYFVLQPWQEMHNLEVLVEEMLLYYSALDEGPNAVEKNKLYAAKVKNKWHRVLVKGMLANGLVSVYELDYGKHELVSIQNVRPLLNMFRKLPFQAITAQLAGVECQQWSEEASIVFRNHVEKKPLVAQVQAVIDATNPWDRKAVVYLVDTSLPDTDIWIHDIMTQYCMEISKAN